MIVLARALEGRGVEFEGDDAGACGAGDLVVDTLLRALVDVEVVPEAHDAGVGHTAGGEGGVLWSECVSGDR